MWQKPKYLITHSLLNAWQYQYAAEDTDRAHEDFMATLERTPVKPNKAMLEGRHFENMVTAHACGAPLDPKHKWAAGIRDTANIVRGGQFQVALYREKRIKGVDFLLYGRLDVLKAGTIYDTKFSHSYEVGKYADSPQHPMYFALCPEARRFVYIVSDGSEVCREEYRPEDCQPIDGIIINFMRYLQDTNLTKTYFEKWKARN